MQHPLRGCPPLPKRWTADTFQQFPIGLFHSPVVYLADVDKGGLCVGMPKCLGDDGQVDVAGVGEAGPCVARCVGRERNVDARHATETLETAVVRAQKRGETAGCGGIPGIHPGIEDGEQERTAGTGMAAEDGGHARLNVQADGSSRLAPAVHERVTPNL